MPLPMEAAAEYNELKAQHPDALIGFEQHGNYEFYGEDAKAAALILNAKLLTKEIPGGQVEVTGFPAEHWQRYFRALWSNGNDVFLAGEQPDGTHEETKYLRKEDYIPLNAKLHISGREFRVESVDFQFRTVSLQEEEDDLPPDMKRCQDCQQPFVFTNNRQQFCPACAEKRDRQNGYQRLRKFREKERE